MGKGIRIFFVTDVHGSNVCYRKFLNALKVYNVDVGILLGDLTGKMLIPLVEKPGIGWATTFMGHQLEITTQEELDKLKKTIEMVGYYWAQVTMDEFNEYKATPKKLDELFNRLMLERLKGWISLADERLAGTSYKVYMAPGNDDHMEVDKVIEDSAAIVNCNNRCVMVGDHEMVTFAWTNPTPWDTPREKPDEELEPMLEKLVANVQNKPNAIFNFHAPPYGFALDLAPELTKDLIQAADRKIHVGSRAVAKMIQKYQPLLGLHGHIHESRGVQKVGKTTIINPGSEYSEGILKGVVIMLEKGKVQDYVFTNG
ncbi:MAG TPA: metallophosphoesterase [Anaerolineaceae bacterium]|nr:metallophosphoesterase [Anaerolineaceae bacterium]